MRWCGSTVHMPKPIHNTTNFIRPKKRSEKKNNHTWLHAFLDLIWISSWNALPYLVLSCMNGLNVCTVHTLLSIELNSIHTMASVLVNKWNFFAFSIPIQSNSHVLVVNEIQREEKDEIIDSIGKQKSTRLFALSVYSVISSQMAYADYYKRLTFFTLWKSMDKILCKWMYICSSLYLIHVRSLFFFSKKSNRFAWNDLLSTDFCFV